MYAEFTEGEVHSRVTELAPLVRRIAQQMLAALPARVELGDLIQSGMLGLFDAARRYQSKEGAQFETYAEQRIRGAILDGLRQCDWAPRSVSASRRRLVVNAVVLERDFVERLVTAADLKLYRVLRQHAERILNDVPRETDFLAGVREAIADGMRDGDFKLARVAAKLAMSPRSLQRRLLEEGAVFKALVDDTRLRLALDFLRHGGHTLTEIAFLLGYSEVSAFHRAFKRWTGLTPSGCRGAAELKGTHGMMATTMKEDT